MKESERVILEALTLAKDQKLRWTNLLKETKLCKRSLSTTLKSLREKQRIQRIVDAEAKEYPPPVYYQLISKIDLVDWFLNKLRIIGFPEKPLEKGKKMLTQDVLLFSPFILTYIFVNILTFNKQTKTQMTGNVKTIPLLDDYNIVLIRSEIEKQPSYTQNPETMRKVLNQINPFSFTVILKAYQIEKTYAQHSFKSQWLTFFQEMTDDLKSNFDKTLEWWNNDVAPLLSSTYLLQMLTVMYFKALNQPTPPKQET